MRNWKCSCEKAEIHVSHQRWDLTSLHTICFVLQFVLRQALALEVRCTCLLSLPVSYRPATHLDPLNHLFTLCLLFNPAVPPGLVGETRWGLLPVEHLSFVSCFMLCYRKLPVPAVTTGEYTYTGGRSNTTCWSIHPLFKPLSQVMIRFWTKFCLGLSLDQSVPAELRNTEFAVL